MICFVCIFICLLFVFLTTFALPSIRPSVVLNLFQRCPLSLSTLSSISFNAVLCSASLLPETTPYLMLVSFRVLLLRDHEKACKDNTLFSYTQARAYFLLKKVLFLAKNAQLSIVNYQLSIIFRIFAPDFGICPLAYVMPPLLYPE